MMRHGGERIKEDDSWWRDRVEEHLRAAEGSTPALAVAFQALGASYLKAE
jgi:hypothetical protein